MAVVIWASQFNPHFASRWADNVTGCYLNFFLILATFAFMMLMRALRKGFELRAFFWSIIVFMAPVTAVTIGYYPFMIPASIALTDAHHRVRH